MNTYLHTEEMWAVLNKIYDSANVTIKHISSNTHITPAENTIKYISGKSESVPIEYSYQANVGVGRSHLAYSTRYESKLIPSTIKFEHTPSSTLYSIKIEGDPRDLYIVCMSKSRQEEILQYLESKKQIQVWFLLGMPIISEINYNAWLENPLLLVGTLGIPTLLLTMLTLQFV